MTRKWIAINLLLLGIAGLSGWRLYVSIKRFHEDNDLARLKTARDPMLKPGPQLAGLPPPKTPKVYNPAEFAVIPNQNLFSESRSKEEKTEAPVVSEAPAMTIRPILSGVTISGNLRLASIVDPSAQGTAKRSQIKRIGDSFQGYTITDITHNQMVLENAGRREVIPLHDSSKRPTQGGKTPIQTTRIVYLGGGTSSGGMTAAPTAVATQRPAQPTQPTPASSIVPAPPQAGAQTTAIRPQGRQVPGAAQPAAAPAERLDPQGRQIIRTPFGDIVRERPPNP